MTDETALMVEEPRRLAPWTPRFALTVDEAVAMVDKKREFMKRVMRENEHFGTIPGTPKPTLYKPGAELLLSAMGLHSDSSINTVTPVIDLMGVDHGGEAFVMFQKTCEIYREEIAGERILIARASANASSWEKKYRYRKADRTCPTCGQIGKVIKGKAEYGGGWLCYKAKGGCGAKFPDSDPRIVAQATGDIPNPEIADLVNTIEKMAAKRAIVAATLLATGCSDIFTQDMDDGPSEDASHSSTTSPDIPANIESEETPPLAEPDGQTIQAPPRAPQPAEPEVKRRGRPLGSKNAVKAGAAPATPEFGDDPIQPFIPPSIGIENQALPAQMLILASRLRKYQYLEKGAALPSTALWEKEIQRTLGIFIERKFGTGVELEDIEEAGLLEAIEDLKGFLAKYESAEEEGKAQEVIASQPPQDAGPSSSDDAVVSIHKPITRNPVAAPKRGGEATRVDPQISLDRARHLSDLRNRTTALLATREGLMQLTAKDEDRLRIQADAVMENVAQNSFQKAIKDLNAEQLSLLVDRAKAAAK